jgi:hypothetical protein
MCRGVRNWPFWPAVAIFPSMYSYRSPLVSRSSIGTSAIRSTTLARSCGVGMVNRASFMCEAYAEPSPPSPRRKGKTCSLTTVNMSVGSRFLNRDHRRSSYGRPFSSFPAGKIGFSIGRFSRLARFSARVWRSSSRRTKSRYVICSMTSSGLEIPPDQNASQSLSTLLLMSPVIIEFSPRSLTRVWVSVGIFPASRPPNGPGLGIRHSGMSLANGKTCPAWSSRLLPSRSPSRCRLGDLDHCDTRCHRIDNSGSHLGRAFGDCAPGLLFGVDLL